MSTLYDEIKAFDKDVADIYQKHIDRIKSGELDETAVMELFGVALGRDMDISPKEVKALMLIWNKAKFSKEGKETWKKALVEGVVMEAYGKGSGKQLKTDKELNEVFNAIGTAMSSVNFTGPKTNITYDVRQYKAMKELIKSGDIHVFDLKDVEILKGMTMAGVYYARLNSLFLLNGAGRAQIVVHELAHAIQDWNDIQTKTDYAEADAYIAQGLAERALKVSVDKNHPFFDAVEMVLAGKATVNNPDWNGTVAKPGVYEKAAAKLRTDSFYKPIYESRPLDDDFTSDETGKPEKDTLAALLKKIDGAKK